MSSEAKSRQLYSGHVSCLLRLLPPHLHSPGPGSMVVSGFLIVASSLACLPPPSPPRNHPSSASRSVSQCKSGYTFPCLMPFNGFPSLSALTLPLKAVLKALPNLAMLQHCIFCHFHDNQCYWMRLCTSGSSKVSLLCLKI